MRTGRVCGLACRFLEWPLKADVILKYTLRGLACSSRNSDGANRGDNVSADVNGVHAGLGVLSCSIHYCILPFMHALSGH